MPEVELHADFDRDGVLTRGAREYGLRFLDPGAVIPIDIDRDGRSLPEVPLAEGAVRLDCELERIEASDDEPLPLQVVVTERAVELLTAISLRIGGIHAATLAVYDGHFEALRRRPGSDDFVLPLEAGRHELRLLAKLPPGSPLGPRVEDPRTAGAVRLEIVARSIAGQEFVIDSGLFQLARFVAGNDLDLAECVYIARHEESEPMVNDVAGALAQLDPAVPLRVVDEIDSRGDGWLRDQFQAGHFLTPSGAMRAILHLPRMRVNAMLGKATENLAAMVRSHFPSSGVGLIEDFWRRTFTLRHSEGEARLDFAAAETLYRKLAWVSNAYDAGGSLVAGLCEAAQALSIGNLPETCGADYWTATSISERRDTLATMRESARTLLRAIRAKDPRRLVGLSAMAARWKQKADIAMQVVAVGQPDLLFRIRVAGRVLAFDVDQLDAAWDALGPVCDSLVYGGNFVVSPPLPSSPFGRVLAGHSPPERPLDPQLVDFLDANSAIQPWVAIDTSWLAVGHVDELLAFVPDAVRGGHAMLRASPRAAMVLLRKAQEKGGATWLMRGRLWREDCVVPATAFQEGAPVHLAARLLHATPPGRVTEGVLSEPVTLPRIAGRLMDSLDAGFDADRVFIYSRACPRYRLASLSVEELLRFEGGTQDVAIRRMEPLDEQLSREFAEFPQLPLPAVFDFPVGNRTIAFTPHLVNLLYVNGMALMPAPCGPRMRPDDAVEVVRHALRETGLSRLEGRVTAQSLRREGLDRLDVWLRPDIRRETHWDPGPLATLEAIAAEFRDGFPETEPAEIERLIRESNRGAFERSGRLKPGWRRLHIPEGTVDLFEVYAHAVVGSLGLRVRFVDCWYHHVRFGGLHCATNALRRAPRATAPWWDRVCAPPLR